MQQITDDLATKDQDFPLSLCFILVACNLNIPMHHAASENQFIRVHKYSPPPTSSRTLS